MTTANDFYSLTLSDLQKLKLNDKVTFKGEEYTVQFALHTPEWIYFRRGSGKDERLIRYGREGWAAGTPTEWALVIRAQTARSSRA